ncbi:hypothetical protein K6Y31_20900 [Motilimonas cestriensis]|uniref:Uncharacterized protein n=1 Tax=Motilimonas cestriensis TaxID=2742685 RepID=A0ABS8WHV7_9GAMM|nr:hypothetical protein [Motilimonas cestriensis]MCE2597236.1 hypothetical protein [Motilimonas cestriensis]
MKCLSVTPELVSVTDFTESCQLIVLEQHDYKMLLGAFSEFDLEVFTQVNTAILLAFFSGHALGRLVKWLGK